MNLESAFVLFSRKIVSYAVLSIFFRQSVHDLKPAQRGSAIQARNIKDTSDQLVHTPPMCSRGSGF